jgi:hypothetical protein
MKSEENKDQVKSARKAAAGVIEASLLTALKKTTAKLGQSNKQFQKAVEKGSKRLAKKLSKEIEFNVPLLSEGAVIDKPLAEAEKPVAVADEKATTPTAAEGAAKKKAPNKKNNSKIPA